MGETTKRILDVIERSQPKHIVLDSLSEIRLLAQSSLRYRRQILALKHYFATLDATVLLLDDMTAEALDKTVHSIAHGVIRLEELAPLYGAERRRLRVLKYRGKKFRGGFHDFKIATGGVEIFTRLVAAEYRSQTSAAYCAAAMRHSISCLVAEWRADRAPWRSARPVPGKRSLFCNSSQRRLRAESGVRCSFSKMSWGCFPSRQGARHRSGEVPGTDGTLLIEQSDAAELSPGEFAHKTRKCVENGVTVLAIDSLNGYQNAMPEEQFLILHMHEVLQFLNRQGVHQTFLTVAQHGLVGDMRATVDITYLADTVLLLRYFETRGRVRRAISVVKKRTGAHEDTVRELRISQTGVNFGAPLVEFEGILSGSQHTRVDGDLSADEGR